MVPHKYFTSAKNKVSNLIPLVDVFCALAYIWWGNPSKTHRNVISLSLCADIKFQQQQKTDECKVGGQTTTIKLARLPQVVFPPNFSRINSSAGRIVMNPRRPLVRGGQPRARFDLSRTARSREDPSPQTGSFDVPGYHRKMDPNFGVICPFRRFWSESFPETVFRLRRFKIFVL